MTPVDVPGRAEIDETVEPLEHLLSRIADDPETDGLKRAVRADAGALSKLAEALLARGRLTEARAAFRYVRGRDPNDIASLKRLVQIERRLGDIPQALELLRAVSLAEPTNVEALTEWAGLLNDAQRTAEAGRVYRRLLELDERYAAAHLGLAWIARTEGEQGRAQAHFVSAIGSYRERVAGAPGDVEARLQLASALRATGALEEASELFAQVIGTGAHVVAARMGLGWIAHAGNDLPAALLHFRAAAAEAPKNMHARLALARMLREAGDFGEAERQYRELATLWPTNAEIQAALGGLASRSGDAESARAYLRAACGLAPGNIAFVTQLARVCAGAEDWPGAEAAYRATLAIDPAALDALLGLSEIAKIRGDIPNALRWCEKAAAAAPADLRPKTELRKLRSMHAGHDWRAELRDALGIAQAPDADSSSQLEAATLLVEYGLTRQARDLLGRIQGEKLAVNKLLLATRQIERMGLEQDISLRTDAGELEFDTLNGRIEKPASGSDTLLIVFGGTNNRLWMTFSLLHRLLQPSGASIVYVRDLRRDWYRSGLEGLGDDFAASAEALRAMAHRYGARRLLTLGNCVGCFGALRYGLALGAQGVLALSPKLRPNDDLKPDQKAAVSAIKARRPDDHINIYDRYATADVRPQVSLLHCQDCVSDAADARHMAGLPDVCVQAIPQSCDPESLKELLMRGLLAPVLAEFVATGAISASLRARIAASGSATAP